MADYTNSIRFIAANREESAHLVVKLILQSKDKELREIEQPLYLVFIDITICLGPPAQIVVSQEQRQEIKQIEQCQKYNRLGIKVLAHCLLGLAKGDKHIHFRDSVITKDLRYILPKCSFFMFACMNPSSGSLKANTEILRFTQSLLQSS